jgi:tRNA/tmRNA/rRNA uracil-C5-methylase (TrmA/RlmC/RlmD family)
VVNFETLLKEEIRKAAFPERTREQGECTTAEGRACSLCHARTLAYADEVRVRDRALQAWWKLSGERVALAPLVTAEPGRGYRTVTKRRAFGSARGTKIGLIETRSDGRAHAVPVLRCAVEPRAHADVYRVVQAKLEKPYAAPLGAMLRHVVVKGGEEGLAVILTVREIDRDVAHAMNTLSKSLTHELSAVSSVFLYHDDSASGTHYLGSRDPRRKPEFRKVFGKAELSETVCGATFVYHPLAFTQVNPFVIDALVNGIGDGLALRPEQVLYDLYCGYGLFALCLAPRVKSVYGAELSNFAVDSAIANAARMRSATVRFHRSDITAEAIQKLMARATPADAVIIDPPRNGTADGVIESIASREPERVAHLFCNIDLLPGELARWKRNGYRILHATPYDMFPGTDDVELLLVLGKE